MCWTTSVRASARHAICPGLVAWAHRCLTWGAWDAEVAVAVDEAGDEAADEAADAVATSGPPAMSAAADSRAAAAEPARRLLRLPSPGSEVECSALERKELPFCVVPIEA